jgi:hypothetical protein
MKTSNIKTNAMPNAPMGKAWDEVSASFDRFCLAAGIDFIGKATDETATQVTRIGLTFLGTSVFHLLSLLSPDSALLGGSERINVPFAGPVSFFGFMLLGPAVLIVLRVYLQIYVEHSERLERLARSMSIVRAPMLVPLQNPLIRYFREEGHGNFRDQS